MSATIPTARLCQHEPTCPWCGHTTKDSFDRAMGDEVCEKCGKPFERERVMLPFYDSRPMASCGLCRRVVRVRSDGTARLHWAPGKTEECPGSKQPVAKD